MPLNRTFQSNSRINREASIGLPATKMVSGPVANDINYGLHASAVQGTKYRKHRDRRHCWDVIPEEGGETTRNQSLSQKKQSRHGGNDHAGVGKSSERDITPQPRVGNDSRHRTYEKHIADKNKSRAGTEKDRLLRSPPREDTKTLKRIRSLANLRRETHIRHLGRRTKSDYECLRAGENLKQRADEFFKVIQSAKFKPHKILEEEEPSRDVATGSLTNISETSIESVEKSARRGKLVVWQKIPFANPKSAEPKLKDSSCQTKDPEVNILSKVSTTQTNTECKADDEEKTVIQVVTSRRKDKKKLLIRKPKTKKQSDNVEEKNSEDKLDRFRPLKNEDNHFMEEVDVDALFFKAKLPKGSYQSDALIKSLTNRRNPKGHARDSFQEVRFRDEDSQQRKSQAPFTKPEKDANRHRRRKERKETSDKDFGDSGCFRKPSKDRNQSQRFGHSRDLLVPLPNKRSRESPDLDRYGNSDLRMKTLNAAIRIPRGVEILEPMKPRKSRRRKGQKRRTVEEEEYPEISDTLTDTTGYSYDDVRDLAASSTKTRLQKHSGEEISPSVNRKRRVKNYNRRDTHKRNTEPDEISWGSRDRSPYAGRRNAKRRNDEEKSTFSSSDDCHKNKTSKKLKEGKDSSRDSTKGDRVQPNIRAETKQKSTTKSETVSNIFSVTKPTPNRARKSSHRSKKEPGNEKVEKNGWKLFELKSPGKILSRPKPSGSDIDLTVPGFSEMSERGSNGEKPSSASTDRLSPRHYQDIIFSPGGRRKKSVVKWISKTIDDTKPNFDQSNTEPNLYSGSDPLPPMGSDDVDEKYKFSNIYEKFRNSVRSRSLQPMSLNKPEQLSNASIKELLRKDVAVKSISATTKELVTDNESTLLSESKTPAKNRTSAVATSTIDTATEDRLRNIKQIESNHQSPNKSQLTSSTEPSAFFQVQGIKKRGAKAGTPLVINEVSNPRTPSGNSIISKVKESLNPKQKSGQQQANGKEVDSSVSAGTALSNVSKPPSSVSRYSNLLSDCSQPTSILKRSAARESSISIYSKPQSSQGVVTSVIESSTCDGKSNSDYEESTHLTSGTFSTARRLSHTELSEEESSITESSISTVLSASCRSATEVPTESSVSSVLSRAFSKLRSATAFSMVSRPNSKILKVRSLTDSILHSKFFRSESTGDVEKGLSSPGVDVENTPSLHKSSDTICTVAGNMNRAATSSSTKTTYEKISGQFSDSPTIHSTTPSTHSTELGTTPDQNIPENDNTETNGIQKNLEVNPSNDLPRGLEDPRPFRGSAASHRRPNMLNTIEERTEIVESDATSEFKSETAQSEHQDEDGKCVINIPSGENDTSATQSEYQLSKSDICLVDENKVKRSCCTRCWHFDKDKPWYMCSGKGPGWRILLGFVLLLLGPFVWFFYLFKLNERISSCCGECWRWDRKEYWFSCKGKGCAWLFIFIPLYIILGPLIFVFLLITVFLVTCCGVSVTKKKTNKTNRGTKRRQHPPVAGMNGKTRSRYGNDGYPRRTFRNQKNAFVPRQNGIRRNQPVLQQPTRTNNEKFKH